jgi:hypothetical protein
MLDTLKSLVQSPRAIFSRASNDSVVSSKSEKPDPATVLASMNRKYRRGFKREHGIFLRGSNVPVVNASIGE